MREPFNFFKKKKDAEPETNNAANQWQRGNNIPNQWSQGGYPPNHWQQPNQKPLVPCVCPRCGANLLIEDGIDTFYCQYCGCKIILQNEANLKTRLGMKKLEHTEKMADKVIGYFDRRNERKAVVEEQKRKGSNISTIIGLLILVMISIGIFFMVKYSKEESDKRGRPINCVNLKLA